MNNNSNSVQPTGGARSPRQSFSGSNILRAVYITRLQTWLGAEYQWKLVYKASKHGFSARSFHNICDNIGETLIIIKSSNGWIFGGFTKKSWNGNDFVVDNDSFIFTLKNAPRVPANCYKAILNRGGIKRNPNEGPCFGFYDGYDICISYQGKNSNEAKSCYIENGNSHGYEYDQKYKSSLLVNTSSPDDRNWFVVEDYEVFCIDRDAMIEPSTYLIGSKIVDKKYDTYFRRWLRTKLEWKCLYRASEHGFTSQSFHEICNNKGPTITVIRSTDGYLFGGYTRRPWSNERCPKVDKFSFIFTLYNPHGLEPLRYAALQDQGGGIFCWEDCGPTFGGSSNSQSAALKIGDKGKNCNENNSCYFENDGLHGFEHNKEYMNTLFVNTNKGNKRNYFTVNEYEVFYHENKGGSNDEEMINIDNLLFSFVDNSKLLNKQVYDKYLREWLGYINDWECIYRASERGFTARSFHDFCNDKGPTLIIIKSSNGYIFGGFTTKSWSGDDFKVDNDAFIFTLYNAYGVPPTRYNVIKDKGGINCSSKNGPVFCKRNSKCDIRLNSWGKKCNEDNSCSINNDGTLGYECHPTYKCSLFVKTAGSNDMNNFSVEDYEVYCKSKQTCQTF